MGNVCFVFLLALGDVLALAVWMKCGLAYHNQVAPPIQESGFTWILRKGNTLVGESDWIRWLPELPEWSNLLRRPSCRVLRLRRTGLPWNPLGDAAKAGAPAPPLPQVVVAERPV